MAGLNSNAQQFAPSPAKANDAYRGAEYFITFAIRFVKQRSKNKSDILDLGEN
jgi:hypothetical protein